MNTVTDGIAPAATHNANPNGERYVCGWCVEDDELRRVVDANAETDICHFCNVPFSERPFAANLRHVIGHMRPFIEAHYCEASNAGWSEVAPDGIRKRIFGACELLDEIGFHPWSGKLFDEVASAFMGQLWRERDCQSLRPSERFRIGWERFKKAVQHERRYTFWSLGDPNEQENSPDYLPVGEMPRTIVEQLQWAELMSSIREGDPIWRVRVHDADVRHSDSTALGPPPVSKALKSNRMSPPGIVMFYGAEDFETACVEMIDQERDWNRSVTGVIYRAHRQISILDLHNLPDVPSFFKTGFTEFRDTVQFLRHFAEDICKPVVASDEASVEHAPTQAFTEYVRFQMTTYFGKSIDGIRYSSCKNGRPCYVLFCDQRHCAPSVNQATPATWLVFEQGSLRTEQINRPLGHPDASRLLGDTDTVICPIARSVEVSEC